MHMPPQCKVSRNLIWAAYCATSRDTLLPAGPCRCRLIVTTLSATGSGGYYPGASTTAHRFDGRRGCALTTSRVQGLNFCWREDQS